MALQLRIFGALVTLGSAQAASILAIFSFVFPAPYMLVTPYLTALHERGHQLTLISAVSSMPGIAGVQHIRVQALEQLAADLINLDWELPMNKWQEAVIVANFFYNSSRYILSDPAVQALLHNEQAHFDLVIVQATNTEALFGFAQHFNAPLLGISAYGTAWNIDYMAGNTAPSVYEPMQPVGYKQGNSLLIRLQNWMYITEEWLLDRCVYLPRQTQLFAKYFPQLPVSLQALRRNFSLILLNQHFSLGRARSNVPNLIEVAGMHLSTPSTPCSAALQQFIDEASGGVIYFSMGIEIMSRWLPKHMQQILLDTFAQLQQRIIWKYELPVLANKSANIYIAPWLPQRQLLAHPNVKLHITHGGLLSIIESAHYGVPMLGLPLYYDQFGNVARMQQLGIALSLDLNKLSVAALNASIQELLTNTRYAQAAKQVSERFRDQPKTPLDTAIWWTEYVLRHQGATYMRLPVEQMALMQYYSVDIITTICGRIALTICLIVFMGSKLLSCLCRLRHFTIQIH